jgi:TIR domain
MKKKMALYEIAIFGKPTVKQLQEFKKQIKSAADLFKLKLNTDIVVHLNPNKFNPNVRSASAAIFFGNKKSSEIDINKSIDIQSIPILPVASTANAVKKEIPVALQNLNCLFLDQVSFERIFSSLLGCLGLLPKQRRIFLSYRRVDATPAAVQLFAELSARQYEVFLDTQAIGPAVNFQEALWHQLCDVDVLVMLETPNYFESRWTTAEFGRALAKGIGVLRVQWPDTTPSIHTATASRAELVLSEIDTHGKLSSIALNRICTQLEGVRTTSHAVRQLSITNSVKDAIKRIGGRVYGAGTNQSMHVRLPSGQKLLLQTNIGVPSAVTLHELDDLAGNLESAIVYDHIGLKRSWQEHLDWLGSKVKSSRWIKQTEAAWQFGAWEATK